MNVLNLGCGTNKLPNAISVDINPLSNPDIIHDLNAFPYPFKDNEFDEVFAISVIEHLDNIITVMKELYRITKSGGIVKIIVPFFSSWSGFTDPTHKHFFGCHSFDYFIKGSQLAKYRYSDFFFKLKKVEYKKNCRGKFKFVDKILLKVANKYKDFYESRISFIFPIEDIYFELEVDK
jgi:ubiquinone/menaquinone biosynthesis C-methylase UbiE